jgi:hypothetical protein
MLDKAQQLVCLNESGVQCARFTNEILDSKLMQYHLGILLGIGHEANGLQLCVECLLELDDVGLEDCMSGMSSKLVEMDRSSLPIEVEEGLRRRSAVAEAIPWAEQEIEIVMFVISCLLLANYESLQL